MKPLIHLVLGIFFVAILYFFFSPVISIFGLAIILFSSVLIDIDHYIYYIFRKKSLNPFKAYNWYAKSLRKLCSMNKGQKKKVYLGFYFFHGIESLILLFLLGFYVSPIFNLILIGFIFHLFVDIFTEIIYEQRFSKISVIYNLFTFKKLTNLESIDLD